VALHEFILQVFILQVVSAMMSWLVNYLVIKMDRYLTTKPPNYSAAENEWATPPPNNV